MDDESIYRPPEELVALIGELVRSSPAVGAMYQEHVEDNDELLPYVLLAEVARWYVERVKRGSAGSPDHAEALAVTALLDQEFAEADPNGLLANGISLGFLEGILPYGRAELPEYVNVLPPHLLDEVERMLGGAPGPS